MRSILQKGPILLVAAALFMAILACNLPGSRPNTPASSVPITTEAVQDLEQSVRSAAETAQATGEIEVVVTEAQLTSLVAFELQKQSEPVLANPQVLLRDGQVQLRGDVQQGGLNAPLEMNMTVSVDDQGRPAYKVVSAKLGPFPLPESILDQLTAQIDQAFTSQIGPEVDKMRIDSITIADGEMKIRGRARQ